MLQKVCISSRAAKMRLIDFCLFNMFFFLCIDTGTPSAISPYVHNRSAVAFAQHNITMIKGKFAKLVTASHKRLQNKEVKVDDIQMFLITLFSSPDSREGSGMVTTVVESAKSLHEIFCALSKYGLWDYLNYSLLQSIIKEFACDDKELNSMMEQYKQDLTGHILALEIPTYLDATHNKNTAHIPPQHNSELFKKLRVKVEANVSDHSLSYVNDLWQSLAAQFALPRLAMILHDIAEGCIGITWLIPANLVTHITRMARRNADKFAEEDILSIMLEEQCIYSMKMEDQQTRECGGYDCEFVSPPPAHLDTKCNICLLVPCKPMQTSCCGHIFCETCIEKLPERRCPLCKKEEFSALPDIRLQQSLEKLQVHCTHQKDGCGWTGELRELDSHLNIQCEFNHYAKNVEEKQTEEQEKQLQKPSINGKQQTAPQMQELSPKLQLTVHTESSNAKFLVNYHFTMKRFEHHRKNNEEWYSEPFHTHEHGYKMCVRIDANGYEKERGTHVSLYIFFLKGEYDDKLEWPFHGQIAVELLDQSEDDLEEGRHHMHTICYDDNTHEYAQRVLFGKMGLGRGKSQFIPHYKLKQYLKNDCLKFRLSILHVGKLMAPASKSESDASVQLNTSQEVTQ